MQRLLKIFQTKKEPRILMVGLDGVGKTTVLYKLKLGEIVTTIHTIGFNVETVEYKGIHFNMWDVGGCDKIRPLWRHYFQNTRAIIFVVDSNDKERMPEVAEEIERLMREDELRDSILLVLANKQDLPNVMTTKEIEKKLDLAKNCAGRQWYLQATCATSGDGLYEALDWLSNLILNAPPPRPPPTKTEETPNIDPLPIAHPLDKPADKLTKTEKQNMLDKQNETVFLKWLSDDKDTTEEFLQKLENGEIKEWDHRTLLRTIWSYITVEDRRNGIKKIFSALEKYYEKFPLTLKNNETWTYFWIQIVHYTMQTTRNPTNEFVGFLFMSPPLMNANMPFGYYKRKTIISPEAAKAVVLPDKQPLPSIVPKALIPASLRAIDNSLRKLELDEEDNFDDSEFLEKFEKYELKKWDHRTHIRMAWAYLTKYGRREGSEKILKGIENFIENSKISRKMTFHLTMSLFWITMLDYYMSSSPKDLTFDEFLQKNPQLMEGGLFLKFYKKDTMLNNPTARKEFVLPDIKPLPSFVPKSTKS